MAISVATALIVTISGGLGDIIALASSGVAGVLIFIAARRWGRRDR